MFEFTSENGVRIHVHEWHPRIPPRGIVQIAHGMGEHAGRYAHLAEYLNATGYIVYANDHRGHGLSMHAGPGHLGADGWNLLVADLVTVSRTALERHPGLPLILLGHSMGSFAVQQYLLEHASLLAGAALTGTTAPERRTAEITEGGEDVDLFRTFNDTFQPVRTEFDWLSRDERHVDAYIADPLCGFTLDARGAADLAQAARRMADPRGIPSGLPLYVAVGDRDPLNARLTLSDLLVGRYRGAGLTDVTYRIYPEARHEVLNEINRDEVVADLTRWINRVTAQRSDVPAA
ncbi:lysophospholipase [Streptomyces sp. DSM 44917]|uniref:Lysophospholipase n=1 Tax=Streptomyces boetiae TaxID=3075541 RepID=A0ABU2LEH4_9ACTN|nr:alpha/beta hydrolase [Streptomyces sp. DSM 44917]MDT0309978.1 lysophospholipase [Streptomyces sp. DSM 44917]